MSRKVIVSDLGNVLVNFDMGIATYKVAAHTKLDENEIFQVLFNSDLPRRHEEGKLTGMEFYAAVKQRLSLKIDFELFKEIWNNIFWENIKVCRLIRELGKDYRLVLLSNIGELHFDYIKTHFDILGEFDENVLSFKVGARKPDINMFKAAVDKAETEPHNIIYVDDRADFIEAAGRCGVNAVRYTDVIKLKNDLSRFGIRSNALMPSYIGI